MRSLLLFGLLCSCGPLFAQEPHHRPLSAKSTNAVASNERVDYVVGFSLNDAVNDTFLSPLLKNVRTGRIQQQELVPWDEDSLVLMSPALGTVHGRMALKPTYRWADAEILDGSEQELGGCDRVRMGLFFTTSAGDHDIMEWRYSRFDALSLMTGYGMDDVLQKRWGPDGEQAIDLERTVPFTVQPGASISFECDLNDDPDFRLLVYAVDAVHGVRAICHTAPGGIQTFDTLNTGTAPLHLLLCAWTNVTDWQQNRIMSTSTDIRVRGLKYYEVAFDGWNRVEEQAGRVFVRFRK